jgi:hypothetical protein
MYPIFWRELLKREQSRWRSEPKSHDIVVSTINRLAASSKAGTTYVANIKEFCQAKGCSCCWCRSWRGGEEGASGCSGCMDDPVRVKLYGKLFTFSSDYS